MSSFSSALARAFPKNVGTLDRLRRLTIGGMFLSLVFVGPETPLALIALYPLLTALFGRCAVMAWLEVDTLEHDEHDVHPSMLPQPEPAQPRVEARSEPRPQQGVPAIPVGAARAA